MNWLVAEDEADIRMLITTMIQVWGHSAAAFENGQKVWDWLDKLEAGEGAVPALALMDIRMPGRKGNELAARMRTLPVFAHTPIILMTAFSMTDAERNEIIERDGVDRIIQKPLPEFEALRQLLHNAIEARKAAPALTPETLTPQPPLPQGEGEKPHSLAPSPSGEGETAVGARQVLPSQNGPDPAVDAQRAAPASPAPAAELKKASEPKTS